MPSGNPRHPAALTDFGAHFLFGTDLGTIGLPGETEIRFPPPGGTHWRRQAFFQFGECGNRATQFIGAMPSLPDILSAWRMGVPKSSQAIPTGLASPSGQNNLSSIDPISTVRREIIGRK